MEEVEEELEAMQLENKQLFQELEFARKDLEIAETRTEELKQLYEKELIGSSQVVLCNKATRNAREGESRAARRITT
jgi:cell division septum initiation protein DivIVA